MLFLCAVIKGGLFGYHGGEGEGGNLRGIGKLEQTGVGDEQDDGWMRVQSTH